MVLVPSVPGTIAKSRKTRRCAKAKGIRIIMIPASRRDADERKSLSSEIERTIAKVRRQGGEVDSGLVRAKEAIDDEKNHLLIARSRWGELLGSLSYTFPDPATIRIDYIGMKLHRCGIGTRLMVAVAELALHGDLKIRLTAERGAKGFFDRLGMEMLEEFPDGNCSFEFSGDGMRSLWERFRRSQ
jgi:Acetyltransferase (GNAT) domain